MQNKYSAWVNVTLILLVLIGFVYAIPNLYTEDPTVEISPLVNENMQILSNKISGLLNNSKIPFKKILTNSNNVEVLFDTTDLQILAQDLIKNNFSTSAYTIALNLRPATPNWLMKIGAEPMKQGLDLRGGVHFLLEVDVNSVITRYYDGLIKNIVQTLREAKIRYNGFHYFSGKGLQINFKTLENRDEAVKEIKYKLSNIEIIRNVNDYSILLTLTSNELNNIRQNSIEQTMSILRNRVNELGVGEAVVQQQGANRIAVDLPGIQDAARAKQILGGTATLQFFLVDSENDPYTAKETGIIPLNDKLYFLDEHPILLKRQVVLNGDAITSAVSGFDQQTAASSVQIQLGGGGESYFSKITKENIGHRMAIVYVETKTATVIQNGEKKTLTKKEERVISAPVIQSALGNNFQITGLKDSKEASNLALLLRAGALPALIYPVEERTIGPSLGKENIQRGLISLEVGMGLILVLMFIYYRLFGLIANAALFINLILLSALLSIIGTTLTLPGIAGFVLTVGMAVDANVLIYERIREELRNGLSPQAAIYAGYDRAFATILDANVTTLIVGIVLFAIGTGPIRGFAVILSLGLLTSMLTSVTYTRAMVNQYYGGRNVKKLSIGI